MKILISNDDGVESDGLRALAEARAPRAEQPECPDPRLGSPIASGFSGAVIVRPTRLPFPPSSVKRYQ